MKETSNNPTTSDKPTREFNPERLLKMCKPSVKTTEALLDRSITSRIALLEADIVALREIINELKTQLIALGDKLSDK